MWHGLTLRSKEASLIRWLPKQLQMPEAHTFGGRIRGLLLDAIWRLVSVSEEQAHWGLPLSSSHLALQDIWAGTKEGNLRFGCCLGLILRDMARILVTILSVQKRVQPLCCSLHNVIEDKNILLPNTPSKTFRLLQVYKFSLIWQDWFSTLYFAKSIVRPKQVKLISAHFLPHPRPLCSLLVI